MQEEVENRTLTLVVSGTKFTGRMFKAAISKYMAHRKEKKLQKQRSRDAPVIPHGKQTVKQLVGQNQGISNIEITDPSIKEFEKIARKYGVDYAVKKDRSSSPPKYLIFFKGRDADALTAAFTEYTNKKVKKATKTERPSVLAKLSQFKEMHISYKPLWHTLLERDMRKEDLRLAAGMTTNMIANMSKEGKHISMDTLARICETLNCEITDVIELVPDEPASTGGKEHERIETKNNGKRN